MSAPKGPTDYMIVINDVRHARGEIKAEEIAEFLLGRQIWIFADNAPHLRALSGGDRLVIYLAGRWRAFIANANVQTQPARVGDALKDELRLMGLTWFTWVVQLSQVRRIRPYRPIRDLIPKLSFIKDKKNYGLYMRRGVNRIPTRDARIIIGA